MKVRDLKHYAELRMAGREFEITKAATDGSVVPEDSIAAIESAIDEGILIVKPETIKIPKPMSEPPEVGQHYYYLVAGYDKGYGCTVWKAGLWPRFRNGIWRTREEVEAVVAAIRGAKDES